MPSLKTLSFPNSSSPIIIKMWAIIRCGTSYRGGDFERPAKMQASQEATSPPN